MEFDLPVAPAVEPEPSCSGITTGQLRSGLGLGLEMEMGLGMWLELELELRVKG